MISAASFVVKELIIACSFSIGKYAKTSAAVSLGINLNILTKSFGSNSQRISTISASSNSIIFSLTSLYFLSLHIIS